MSPTPPNERVAESLFDPPGEAWQRLSPRYRDLKHLMVLIVWGIWAAAAVVATGLLYRWWAAGLVAVAFAGWIVYRYWRVGRVFAAWGYAERATDLYLRRGILVRRLTAVPYGRMQVVEVNSGPIERHYGLATVKLVTASPHTDAVIPGLASADAAVLRDRLAERGEHQSMGL